jgi:hypothetical protein
MGDFGQTFERATGSGSMHKEDWLNTALLAAAAITGGAALAPEAAAVGAGAEGASAAGLGLGELGGGFGGQFGADLAASELGGSMLAPEVAGFGAGGGAEGFGMMYGGGLGAPGYESLALGSGALPGGMELGGQATLLTAPNIPAGFGAGGGGGAGAFGVSGADPVNAGAFGHPSRWAGTSKGLSPTQMMQLGKMVGQIGSTPKQQGGPQADAFAAPSMRSALATQEEITRKWLKQNDPNTYRRIYGEPKEA